MKRNSPLIPLTLDFIYSHCEQRGDCLIWLGCRGTHNPRNYGHLLRNGRSEGIHRAVYELTRGPIPAGILVCHTCDVRSCVRPEHLFLGTIADNIRDMDQKGRRYTGEPRYGADNNKSKLTAEQVTEIRHRYRPVYGMMSKLAREYGISWAAMEAVLRGKCWQSAPGPWYSTSELYRAKPRQKAG